MMPLRAISAPFAQPLQAVLAVEDPLRPRGVGKVPVDRGGQAVLEVGGGGPTQFVADLAGIDRVAAVVAGPVAYEGDLACTGLPVRARVARVEQAADRLDHLDVPALGIAAVVVALAHSPRL